MDKHKDIISYDVYELDLYDLKQKVGELNVDEVIVYGIGNNGAEIYRLFKNIGVKIKYYLDVKARNKVHTFKGIKVVDPDVLPEMYKGEYIVISPSIHDSIYDWMRKQNIPDEKLILSFYKTESISIDYGNHYDVKPSADIEYCGVRTKRVKATFVTIAYNTPENLLRRAIESVLRQTLRELKYLFILNGPTDDTARIVKEYAKLDARICVIDMGSNLPWTDIKLLSAIRDNIEGDYCCQLDSDDYYDERFLEETVEIGDRNQADIVCVRTCLFCADSEYNPMNAGLDYDWHDKFYFNVVHPQCHIIGHKNIMIAYARAKICSTFWGKMYTNTLMKRYLDYLTHLSAADRELYYRLDIAMTYRILSMAERVFYSDKVLHFSQYSKKNSTFTLAPIEWLMSLWYSYKGLKDEICSYYGKKKAKAYSKGFLEVHLLWMVGRKGMLDVVDSSKYRDSILDNFREMISDKIFKSILINKRQYMKADCQEFYERVYALSGRRGMTFEKMAIDGCRLIKRNIPLDNRGYFSRLADVGEFKANGLNGEFVQISASKNYRKGTLRGMHMQAEPSAEEKLVCCVEGEVYDVCVDLRKDSPTYLKYCSAVLSEENGQALYIPKGCAHGFVSLKDNSQLIYFMTSAYDPKSERGYRWNDPAFSIEWPVHPAIISEKDNAWPLIGDRES